MFLNRPNRFIAECLLDGEKAEAHVRNTGRCRELLVPGCTVYLDENCNTGRKTRFTLVSVEKSDRVINIDSLAPNKVFYEAMADGQIDLPGFGRPFTLLKPESRYGGSRFDFYMENGGQKAFAEIKGVTLEEDGVVLFPDAPTERGVKHIHELCRAAEDGYLSYLVFVIQMKNVKYLTPNRKTHPAFGEALSAAQKLGVKLLAFDCYVTPSEIRIADQVNIKL